jgi:hypothetical protein
MEIGIRVGGERTGEITDPTSQPRECFLPHLEAKVKKATREPSDSGPIGTDSIKEILKIYFPALRKPVVKNLSIVVAAFMTVLEGMRSGNGKLTLSSLARALPLAGRFKTLYQRLSRFLRNKFFDAGCLTEGLFTLLVGRGLSGLLPVIVDQTQVGSVLVILAGIAFSGRVFPVGIHAYTNKDIHTRPEREKSRNWIEVLFLMRLLEACPATLTLLFILDRGYARVSLIRQLLGQPGAMFLMRAPKNVMVRYRQGRRDVQTPLGKIPIRHRQMIRLTRAFYRKTKSVQVDIVVYWEREFKEPWYLVLPPGSDDSLPTEKVVELYRSRMRVEQGFRDFKHHLGIRGLDLEVDQAERLGRLLQGFLLAYTLTLALGETIVGQAARERFETPRRKPRHGTIRILSAFRIGSLLLSGFCSLDFEHHVRRAVERMVSMLKRRVGLYFIVGMI